MKITVRYFARIREALGPGEDLSFGAEAPAMRSGQPSASAMGSRMSGGDAWAIVEPSVKVTIECTTDCRWTVTSMRS